MWPFRISLSVMRLHPGSCEQALDNSIRRGGPGTPEPGEAPSDGRTRTSGLTGLGAPCRADGRPGMGDHPLRTPPVGGRTSAGGADDGACHSLRTLRLPAGDGAAPAGRLAGEPQAGRANVATRGTDDAGEATETWVALARRRADRADGRGLRLLTIINEYTRECLSIDLACRLYSEEVLAPLAERLVRHGVPVHIRSDNGPGASDADSTSLAASARRVDAVHRARESVGEGVYGVLQRKLRDEYLNLERFETRLEVQVLVERWRCEYN